MKKGKNKQTPEPDDLRPEYDLSELRGGVRGKYYRRFRSGTNLALLAPDVRAAFPTDEAVNRALRSLMQAKRMADESLAGLDNTKGSQKHGNHQSQAR